MSESHAQWRPWWEEPCPNPIVSFLDGSRWRIGDRIWGPTLNCECYPCENRAVYQCFFIDPERGLTDQKAALKVKWQVDSDLDDDWPSGPTDMPPEWTQSEMSALERLTEEGCEHSPILINLLGGEQTEGEIFPGAYVYYILMSWVPGRQLTDFWEYPTEARDTIRRAFKLALSDVIRCGVFPSDTWPRNILWDDESSTCYIMDYEDAGISADKEVIKECAWLFKGAMWLQRWNDYYFAAWGLARDGPDYTAEADGSDLKSFALHPKARSFYRKNRELIFGTPETETQVLDHEPVNDESTPPSSVKATKNTLAAISSQADLTASAMPSNGKEKGTPSRIRRYFTRSKTKNSRS